MDFLKAATGVDLAGGLNIAKGLVADKVKSANEAIKAAAAGSDLAAKAKGASDAVSGLAGAAKGVLGSLFRGSARASARRGGRRSTCTSRKIFNHIDTDNSGKISMKEIISAFKRADVDKSETLTYEEFLDACDRKKAAAKRATPKKAAAKRATPKKAAAKRATPKKAAPKKAAPKKTRATPKAAPKKKAESARSSSISIKMKKMADGGERPSAGDVCRNGGGVGTTAYYGGKHMVIARDVNGRCSWKNVK